MVDDLLVVPTRFYDHTGFLVAPLAQPAFRVFRRIPFPTYQLFLQSPGLIVDICEGPLYLRAARLFPGRFDNGLLYFLALCHIGK